MDLTPREHDLLASDLRPFVALTGDRRTAALRDGVLRGIIASERLVCARIAACSPTASDEPAR